MKGVHQHPPQGTAAIPIGRRIQQSALWGFLLCTGLGAGVLTAMRFLPPRTYLPDILIALFVGAFIVNTPLRRLLGARSATELRDTGAFSAGLKFVGRTVLRLAVVFMGLKIQARFFGVGELLVMFAAIAVAMPTTFFLTHAMARPLRVSRSLADLIAAGTMICGASAVNAMAPVCGAKKQDQAIALGTVFLFSIVAMFAFRPIAIACGIPTLDAGLWAGLSVNDLSSAVAVGAQMGPGGAEMAAASKSARVVLLAPILIIFALIRCSKTTKPDLRQHALKNLPSFVAGFVVFALGRWLGDHYFGKHPLWLMALEADKVVVDVAMMAVAVGIGFHLDVRGLLSAGARALVLGAIGSSTMASLSLFLVVLGKRDGLGSEAILGLGSLVFAFGAFRAARVAERASKQAAAAATVPQAVEAAATTEEADTERDMDAVAQLAQPFIEEGRALARSITGRVRLPTQEVAVSSK